MKRMISILLLASLALTSCSFGGPKPGGKCDNEQRPIGSVYTEKDANGDYMYCSIRNTWVHANPPDWLREVS